MEQRLKIREFLNNGDVRLAPSCGSALEAAVVEMLGFDAVHLSQEAVHKSLGLADAGLITLTELAGRLSAITETVNLSVIVDGGTGFGNVRNLRRSVRVLERAGAAAIHFEDGQASTEEMLEKLEAALDERHDPNMAIVARCEDRTSNDVLIERLIKYAGTGIDALWSSGFDADVIGPVRAAAGNIPFIGVPTDRLIRKETAQLGVHIMIFPTIPTVAAAWGVATVLRTMRVTGSPDEAYRTIEGLTEMHDWLRDLGENRYK